MKYAKIMVIIVIFVFAMSVSCAADTNNASISEDNSQMLLSLKNEITDDTSENSILAQTNNDETLSAQKNSEILKYYVQMKEPIQTYIMTFLIWWKLKKKLLSLSTG